MRNKQNHKKGLMELEDMGADPYFADDSDSEEGYYPYSEDEEESESGTSDQLLLDSKGEAIPVDLPVHHRAYYHRRRVTIGKFPGRSSPHIPKVKNRRPSFDGFYRYFTKSKFYTGNPTKISWRVLPYIDEKGCIYPQYHYGYWKCNADQFLKTLYDTVYKRVKGHMSSCFRNVKQYMPSKRLMQQIAAIHLSTLDTRLHSRLLWLTKRFPGRRNARVYRSFVSLGKTTRFLTDLWSICSHERSKQGLLAPNLPSSYYQFLGKSPTNDFYQGRVTFLINRAASRFNQLIKPGTNLHHIVTMRRNR